MNRPIVIGIAVAAVFLVVAVIMWQLMPEPRRNIDYMVIGGTATMIALAVLFLVLVNTTYKRTDTFYRKRKE